MGDRLRHPGQQQQESGAYAYYTADEEAEPEEGIPNNACHLRNEKGRAHGPPFLYHL